MHADARRSRPATGVHTVVERRLEGTFRVWANVSEDQVYTGTKGDGCRRLRGVGARRHDADGSGTRLLYRPPQVDSSEFDDLPPGSPSARRTNVCGHSTALYVMSAAGGRPREVVVSQPLTSVTCSRGALPGDRTCTQTNIGFDAVAW
jgi:hypothetical protein